MQYRRLVVLIVLVMVAGVVVATASVATAREGGPGFEVVAIPVQGDVPIDQGWVLQDRMETTDGEVLGWDGGSCISVDPDPLVDDRYMCELVMHFPDGDIVAVGSFSIPEFIEGDTVFAVTGGSGAFRFVQGDVQVIPEEDFSSSRVIFRVTGNTVRY